MADPLATSPISNSAFLNQTTVVSLTHRKFHAVIDDKLYVFLNRAIFDEFNKDRAGTISKAGDQWQGIRSTAVKDL